MQYLYVFTAYSGPYLTVCPTYNRRLLLTLFLACLTLALWAQRGFTPNRGQWEDQVRFRSDLESGALFLEDNAFTYHFYDGHKLHENHLKDKKTWEDLRIKHHAFRVKFRGASQAVKLKGSKPKPHFTNYFLGKDRSKWQRQVPAFETITYTELYPGIDLIIYEKEGRMKYDLHLAAGVSTNKIKMDYAGANDIVVKDGALVVKTSLGELIEQRPEAWQVYKGAEIPIACEFRVSGETVSFVFPDGIDQSLPLVIDPTLIFSTYSGSTSNNFGYSATFDSKGFLYAGSTSFGIGYPTTIGAYDTTFAGGNTDIVISKYDTTGSFLVYSTYLGGNQDELPHSLIVNDQDELYLYGTTGSNNFPVTPNAYDTSFATGTGINLTNGLGVNFPNGVDMIVAHFNQAGTDLLNCTYLGGNGIDGLNTAAALKYNYADEVRGEVMIDDSNDIYIASCTQSVNFPMVGNTVQGGFGGGGQDGIIVKLNADLSSVYWSTFFGGAGADAIYSIAIDKNNEPIVAGGTDSPNLFTSTGALQGGFQGGLADGFIMQLNAAGSAFQASTYYGSSAYDQVYFVELDRSNNVHVFGQTEATGNTFIFNANYNQPGSGQFVSKMNPTLTTLTWSTAFGTGNNTPNISPTAFLVDVCNAVYLSGWGSDIQGGALSTSGLQTTTDGFDTTTAGDDFYLLVIAGDANNIIYGSFFGGDQSQEHVDGGTSRFDRKGRIYQSVCAGCGGFDDFPIEPAGNVVSATNGSANGCNNGVFKLDFNLPIVVADFSLPAQGCDEYSISFTNTSLEQSATTYLWDFGDSDTSTAKNPTHIYSGTGTYTITLIATDTASCNSADTVTKVIEIVSDTSWTIPGFTICPGDSQPIGIPIGSVPANHNFSWFPTSTLSDTSLSDPLAFPTQNTTYEMRLDDGVCVDTIFQTILLDPIAQTVLDDTLICSDTGPVTLTAFSNGLAVTHYWSSNPQFTDTLNTNPADSSIVVNPTQPFTTYYVQVANGTGCSYTDSLLVTIYDLANTLDADFVIPSEGCLPLSFNPQNNTPLLLNTEFLWDFGNGVTITGFEPTVTYDSLGTFQVTLFAFDTTICFMSDTFTQTIVVRSDSSYSLDSILACPEIGATIGVPPLNDSVTTYTWIPDIGLDDPNVANPNASPGQSILYTLIIDYGFCRDSVTQFVELDPLESPNLDDLVFCSTQSPVELSTSSTGTSSILWSSTASFADTLNNFPSDSSITVIADSANPINQFFVQVTSPNNCVLEDSALVTFSDLAFELAQDTFICKFDDVTLFAQPLNPAVNYSYDWEPQRYIDSQSPGGETVVADPRSTTWYTVTVTGPNSCTRVDSIQVRVSELSRFNVEATSEFSDLPRNAETELQATPDSSIFTYAWGPPNSGITSPDEAFTTAFPIENTTYIVTVTDPGVPECAKTGEAEVRVYESSCGEPEIFIPNSFSPNADGKNDLLFVHGPIVRELHLQVFDRWGHKVFETTDRDQGWDGKFKEKELDPAVFVYHLEAVCFDEQRFFKKGNVTLIR